MNLAELARIARVAREVHEGQQLDPVAYEAAFVDGFAAFELREEKRHRDDCNQINVDLVELLEQHPSLSVILGAVASVGGRIDVGAPSPGAGR